MTFARTLDYTDPRRKAARFAIGMEAAIGSAVGDVFLPPYGIYSHGWQFGDLEDNPPPDVPAFAEALESPVDAAIVPVIARRLLELLYPYFKRNLEEIPYLTEDRDAVDPTSFERK